jgi:hypothetical protein
MRGQRDVIHAPIFHRLGKVAQGDDVAPVCDGEAGAVLHLIPPFGVPPGFYETAVVAMIGEA